VVDAGDRESVVIGEVDPKIVARVREQFPFLTDRRT
jgi:predicted amidohydrolase